MILYKLYKCFTIILSPFVIILIFIRLILKKETSKGIFQRLGIKFHPREKGKKYIHINAASIGELNSSLHLINWLNKNQPDCDIMVTTTTVTSAKIAKLRLPKNVIHQYFPVDIPFVIKRFLRHWSPEIIINIDSEIWPNFVVYASKYSKIMLVSARMSERSCEKWKKILPLAKFLLNKVSLILPQDIYNQSLFLQLSVKKEKVEKCVNLKYFSAPLPFEVSELEKIKNSLGNKLIIVASSTHPGEEKIISTAYKEAKKSLPNLFLIIVPRHPSRKAEIIKDIGDLHMDIKIRSEGHDINEKTDIYLADTIGELGIFYRLANLAIIGGSLIEKGGQNLIEPIMLNCPVLVGPSMKNFWFLYNYFSQHNAIFTISDPKELQEKLNNIMSDKYILEKTQKDAYLLLQNLLSEQENNLSVLNNFLLK